MANPIDRTDLEGLRSEIRRLQESLVIAHSEAAAQRSILLGLVSTIDDLFGEFALPLAELMKLKRDAAAHQGLDAKAAFIESFVDELGDAFDIPAND